MTRVANCARGQNTDVSWAELGVLSLVQRCSYRKQRASDLVGLVFRERILCRILIDATSNAEPQNQIVTLTKLMDFNSLLRREKC